MLNNKAQMILFGLLLMIFIFAIAMVLIQPIRETVQQSMAYMNCSNPNITVNAKSTCTIVDLMLPYFIVTLLIGSAAYLFYRMATAG